MSDFYYVSTFLAEGGQYLLFWRDGGDAPDSFLLESVSQKLVVLHDKNQVLAAAAERRLKLAADEDGVTVDVDWLFGCLDHLREGGGISTADCSRILIAWNQIEDLQKSLGMQVDWLTREERLIIQAAYEKIFAGANILQWTPDRASDRFELNKEELVQVSRLLGWLWERVFSGFPQESKDCRR